VLLLLISLCSVIAMALDLTCRFEAFEFEGRFFVNPGSATGAWSGLWNGSALGACLSVEKLTCSEATPSFALMDVQGPVIVTYVYQLVDGEVRGTARVWRTTLISEVKVDKVEYRKSEPPREVDAGRDGRAEVAAAW
jgi:vacuolar protein sorting-associated protein 29